MAFLEQIIFIGILLFGVIWTIVNVYNFYPLVRRSFNKLLGRDDALYYPEDHVPEDEERPTIDVLLPAYKEGNVIHQAIISIRETDYPQDKINVNVLVEPGDGHTRQALDMLRDDYEFREIVLPQRMQEVVVPDDYPGHPNKPRALDFGFEMTDGDIVGIIDAEDVVSEDLFGTVAAALTDGYDYVQGILDMVNEDDGWRNMVFRAEYSFWYRLLLPAYHAAGYGVPLGGTTNFFRREVLEDISAERKWQYGPIWSKPERRWFREHGMEGKAPWDPENVTEDFELGLFLCEEGYDFTLIDCVTKEESPLTTWGWITQRTRWQKGRLYTFMQYLRHPPENLKHKTHCYMQSFVPHLAPVNVAGILLIGIFANLIRYNLYPTAQAVTLLSGIFLVAVLGIQSYSYLKVTDKTGPEQYIRAIMCFPLGFAYWIYLWYAEFRAIKQLYFSDLRWEKTEHHGRNTSRLTKPG